MNDRETAIQFVKFSIIGVLNTAVHYTVFLLVFRILGVYYLVATTIGYSVATLNSFILNKKWTFRTNNLKTQIVFVKFVAVNVASLCANILALRWIVEYGNLRPEMAQPFAIIFSTIVNFLGNKLWTFQPGKHASIPPLSDAQQSSPEE